MPFNDRFAPNPGRPDLSFRPRVSYVKAFKDDWSFISDKALRSNIAYTLQSVQLSVLLVNEYNVFGTPAAMIYKNAIIQVASVVEAVLQYDLKMVEDDPQLKDILGKEWVFVDSKEIPLPGVSLPEGQRAITGLQRMVEKERLDNNAKMQVLIRASKKLDIVTEETAAELDELRKLRNRIHIKTLDKPECWDYAPKMANDAFDLLERYRDVAADWTTKKREQTLAEVLASRTTPGVSAPEGLTDLGASTADDDIRF